MSFSAEWLGLREPADHAARDPGLLAKAAAYVAAAEGALIVDLGAGTGSTRRAFGERLPRRVSWRMIDNDPELLAILRASGEPGLECVQADLGDPSRLGVADARLVTVSALFDLMPLAFVTALAEHLARHAVACYAALTYDGTMTWSPPHSLDREVVAAFNTHQKGDKGLGPALGPAAGDALAAALTARGYDVRSASSPWRLGPDRAQLQDALSDGIAAAAAAMGLSRVNDWAQARRAASGSASCTVGHVDLLALPGSFSAQSKTTSDPRP